MMLAGKPILGRADAHHCTSASLSLSKDRGGSEGCRVACCTADVVVYARMYTYVCVCVCLCADPNARENVSVPRRLLRSSHASLSFVSATPRRSVRRAARGPLAGQRRFRVSFVFFSAFFRLPFRPFAYFYVLISLTHEHTRTRTKNRTVQKARARQLEQVQGEREPALVACPLPFSCSLPHTHPQPRLRTFQGHGRHPWQRARRKLPRNAVLHGWVGTLKASHQWAPHVHHHPWPTLPSCLSCKLRWLAERVARCFCECCAVAILRILHRSGACEAVRKLCWLHYMLAL